MIPHDIKARIKYTLGNLDLPRLFSSPKTRGEPGIIKLLYNSNEGS